MRQIRKSGTEVYLFTILTLLIPLILLYGCSENIPVQKEPAVQRTELNIPVIADTVIYDVIVKNPEPDNHWTEESLRNLNRDALVDFIFNAVYRKELVPFDYFTSKALSVDAISGLENDPVFSRDNIGSIQFVEEWYFDEVNLRMEKRVNSITLGYEIFDSEGNLRGYKPAFTVKLN